ASYFFTLNLADRKTDSLTRHIHHLREAFREVQSRHPFAIPAAVVLPDHLHCLWELPEGDSDFATRWGLIKAAFSRALPATEPRSASRRARGERGIWQRRFWEHRIRDDEDYRRHVEYIHFNPVKHGHAVRAANWPYSSFKRFVDAGLYPENWGMAIDTKEPAAGER
ncbi:MAG: REP-associated tyrosine transposase, partial [Pseudomonas sp.]